MAKKKLTTFIIACGIVCITLLALFCPIYVTAYDDGGTWRFTSLTYTVMKWEVLSLQVDENGEMTGHTHQSTCVYFFPDNFKDYDQLWEIKH